MSAAVEAAAVTAGGGVPGATAAATGSVSLDSETLGVLDFETVGLSEEEGGLSKAKAYSKAFMKQKAQGSDYNAQSGSEGLGFKGLVFFAQ